MADNLDNSAPFNDKQGTRIAKEPTGAGAEAAEGIHGSPKGRDSARKASDNTSVEGRDKVASGGDEPVGSEPLTESEQHRSSYGGDGGKPKG